MLSGAVHDKAQARNTSPRKGFGAQACNLRALGRLCAPLLPLTVSVWYDYCCEAASERHRNHWLKRGTSLTKALRACPDCTRTWACLVSGSKFMMARSLFDAGRAEWSDRVHLFRGTVMRSSSCVRSPTCVSPCSTWLLCYRSHCVVKHIDFRGPDGRGRRRVLQHFRVASPNHAAGKGDYIAHINRCDVACGITQLQRQRGFLHRLDTTMADTFGPNVTLKSTSV